MKNLLPTIILAGALAACGGDSEPNFESEIDAYWSNLDVSAQSQICVMLADETGFELVTALADDDGVIELEGGGEIEDTLTNRQAVGAALDAKVEEVC